MSKVLKGIAQIIKITENNNKKLRKDKTLEDPIMNDIVKTNKAIGYEKIKELVKKEIKRQKS